MPPTFRRQVFDALHSLSHPGIRVTEVCQWTCQCIQFQRNKVHRHTVAPLPTFNAPDAQFDHIHIDIVGLLPSSNGYSYLLTCID